MSLLSIKVRNYRNIPRDNPVELKIQNDITFLVSVNNVGKTNCLFSKQSASCFPTLNSCRPSERRRVTALPNKRIFSLATISLINSQVGPPAPSSQKEHK